MQITRYKTILSYPSVESRLVETTNLAVHHYGPYVVDDSGFVPMSEAVKRVTGGALSKAEIAQMYDFPDGRVTSGFRVPLDRRADYHGDIAEVSKATREAAAGAAEELAEARKQFEFEQRLNAINGVSGDNNHAE